MIRNNNNQQGGRRRGRGGGQGGGGGMPQRAPGGQNYGNNRLDIRQRGNATQLLDKYKTLARDAAQQGDRVSSEYYLQYADHYFRVLNEIRERQPEHQRGPRPGYDSDEEGDENSGGYNPNYAQANENRAADAEREEANGDGRYDNGQRDGYRRDGQADRGQRDDDRQDRDQRDNGQRDNGQRDNGQDDGQRQYEARGGEERQDGRRDSPRRDDNRRDRNDSRGRGGQRDAPRAELRDEMPADDAAPRIDREEQPMISGLPGPATLSPAEATEGVPPSRRRGRPRKVVDAVPVDTVDA